MLHSLYVKNTALAHSTIFIHTFFNDLWFFMMLHNFDDVYEPKNWLSNIQFRWRCYDLLVFAWRAGGSVILICTINVYIPVEQICIKLLNPKYINYKDNFYTPPIHTIIFHSNVIQKAQKNTIFSRKLKVSIKRRFHAKTLLKLSIFNNPMT